MTSQAERIELGVCELIDCKSRTAVSIPTVEVSAPVDPTAEQMMRIVEVSGTLDFWDSEDEDIYTPDDGTAA